jgi:hypothetical protein
LAGNVEATVSRDFEGIHNMGTPWWQQFIV